MTDSINNGIPYVPENTIDQAAAFNESINVIDALIQVDVISLTVTTPPASPAVGDRYIVPTGATGAWSGKAGKLARWEEGLFWAFYNAQFVTNNGVAYTKTTGGWSVISGSGEANTASNLGTGTGLAAPKSGVNLPFKSLKAGSNVTITSDPNEITISSTGGGGSAEWGDIGGDIEDQADLIDLLDEKEFALVAGTNITINRSNPKAPVISATGGGSGDVVGPSSATANSLAQFDGATGKLLKSGPLVTDFATSAQGALADTALQDAPEDGEIYARQDGDWVEIPPSLSNPMTTEGDMIRGAASGAPERVAAGTNGHVWTVVAGVPEWAAPAGGSDVWLSRAIGEPFPIWDHIAGVAVPPTDDPAYRYIRLTASDSYNTGVLTSESVSGSAPLVQATAVISDSGSPINGQPVRLINTERRVLRGGSSGTIEADAFQGHTLGFGPGTDSVGAGSFNLAAGGFSIAGTGATFGIKYSIFSDGVNGTPRTANETRQKNIGATYYMRIK